MPPFAQIQPELVSTISAALVARTTRRESARISSTSRGSRSVSAAIRRASAPGSTVRLSRIRPSDLETTLCETTTMSPSASSSPVRAAAPAISAPSPSPSETSGSGSSASTSSRAAHAGASAIGPSRASASAVEGARPG